MNAPLSREELRRLMLKRIRKQQMKAIPGTGVILSEADNYLSDRKSTKTLDHLERRYLALQERLVAENNTLQVLVLEFIADVAEAHERGTSLSWVYSDRAANRAAQRRAFEALGRNAR